MKIVTSLALTLSLTLPQFAKADCYDMYNTSLNKELINWDFSREKDASEISPLELAGGSLGATLIWAGFSAGTLLVVPAVSIIGGAAAIDGVIALTNIKEKKMMKLITDANNYASSGGKSAPGKTLKKLKARIDLDVDLYTLARHISKANKDGSLCQSLPSFKRLVRDINKEVVVIDGEEI